MKCFSVSDLQAKARRNMPRMVFDALDGATGNEAASRRNTAAFEEVCLQGRVLVNVEDRSLKTRFLGEEWQMPFGVAPMGMGNLFWPGATRHWRGQHGIGDFLSESRPCRRRHLKKF